MEKVTFLWSDSKNWGAPASLAPAFSAAYGIAKNTLIKWVWLLKWKINYT